MKSYSRMFMSRFPVLTQVNNLLVKREGLTAHCLPRIIDIVKLKLFNIEQDWNKHVSEGRQCLKQI